MFEMVLFRDGHKMENLYSKSVLWHLHEAHTAGCLGIKKTWENAKSCPFFRQQMNETTADYVKACRVYAERNDKEN